MGAADGGSEEQQEVHKDVGFALLSHSGEGTCNSDIIGVHLQHN